MREIKFRAWDKVDEKMRRVLQIDFDWGEGESLIYLEKIVDGERKVYRLGSSQVELMQYTGLKDHDGKEVYEEDIVEQIEEEEEWDKKVGWIWRKSRGVVKFVNGMFRAGASLDFSKSKVIGNIYEHRELLEGQDNGKIKEKRGEIND